MLVSPALVLPIVLAAVAPAASAAATPPADRPNVSITLSVGRSGGASGAAEKVYKILGQEGATTRMLVGWRTPIPTRSSDDKGGETPATSYVYQNVGLTADLDVEALPGDRLLVAGQLEISGAREGQGVAAAGGRPPMIGTYQQALRVVLKNGEKLRVAEGPDPEGGTMFVDLRVDRLK